MTLEGFKKVIQSIRIYLRYFHKALLETYLHYTSPYPIYIFLKRWPLANRGIRVLWGPSISRKKPPRPRDNPVHCRNEKTQPDIG